MKAMLQVKVKYKGIVRLPNTPFEIDPKDKASFENMGAKIFNVKSSNVEQDTKPESTLGTLTKEQLIELLTAADIKFPPRGSKELLMAAYKEYLFIKYENSIKESQENSEDPQEDQSQD